jgi:hypothetical protein
MGEHQAEAEPQERPGFQLLPLSPQKSRRALLQQNQTLSRRGDAIRQMSRKLPRRRETRFAPDLDALFGCALTSRWPKAEHIKVLRSARAVLLGADPLGRRTKSPHCAQRRLGGYFNVPTRAHISSRAVNMRSARICALGSQCPHSWRQRSSTTVELRFEQAPPKPLRKRTHPNATGSRDSA